MDIQSIKNKIIQDLKCVNCPLDMSYYQYQIYGVSPEQLKEALEQLKQENKIDIEEYSFGVSITLKNI